MNLNQFIKKSHIRALEKFNQELIAFAQRTEEYPPELYEDAFTHFTLWNVRVENGKLCYEYDGVQEHDNIVLYDEEERTYYEDEFDGIMQAIRFWRSCLRRAIKYWEMDLDQLNDIYDEKRPDIMMDDDED